VSASPLLELATGLELCAAAVRAMANVQEAPAAGQPLSAKKAGAALGLSADRIYRLVRSGELRAIRVGKSVRIEPAELESFRKRRTR